jgi:hypothetical protein
MEERLQYAETSMGGYELEKAHIVEDLMLTPKRRHTWTFSRGESKISFQELGVILQNDVMQKTPVVLI